MPRARTVSVPSTARADWWSAATLLTLLIPTMAVGQGNSWIEVRTPEAWSGQESVALTVSPGEWVRVEGRAGHPSGIERVTIDGEAAAVEPGSDGGYEFVGFARPAPGAEWVEIAVHPAEGSTFARRYSVATRVQQATMEPWKMSGVQIGLYAYAGVGTRNPGLEGQALFRITDAIALGGGFSRAPTNFRVNDESQAPHVEYYAEGRWYFGSSSLVGWVGPHVGHYSRAELAEDEISVVEVGSVTLGVGGGGVLAMTEMVAIDLGAIWLATPASVLVRAGLQVGF